MRPGDLRFVLEDGILRARIDGEIDMSNAAELRRAIEDGTPNDAFGVVLDLSNIDYLDSAGIHLIYRLRDRLHTRGQDLRVVIPEGSVVSDTLRLAGIGRGPNVAETSEEAVQALLANENGGLPAGGAA